MSFDYYLLNESGRRSSNWVTLLSQSAHFGVISSSKGSSPGTASSWCRSNWFSIYNMCQLNIAWDHNKYYFPVHNLWKSKIRISNFDSVKSDWRNEIYPGGSVSYDINNTTLKHYTLESSVVTRTELECLVDKKILQIRRRLYIEIQCIDVIIEGLRWEHKYLHVRQSYRRPVLTLRTEKFFYF